MPPKKAKVLPKKKEDKKTKQSVKTIAPAQVENITVAQEIPSVQLRGTRRSVSSGNQPLIGTGAASKSEKINNSHQNQPKQEEITAYLKGGNEDTGNPAKQTPKTIATKQQHSSSITSTPTSQHQPQPQQQQQLSGVNNHHVQQLLLTPPQQMKLTGMQVQGRTLFTQNSNTFSTPVSTAKHGNNNNTNNTNNHNMQSKLTQSIFKSPNASGNGSTTTNLTGPGPSSVSLHTPTGGNILGSKSRAVTSSPFKGKVSIGKGAIHAQTGMIHPKKKWKVFLSGFGAQTKEFNRQAILDLDGECIDQLQPDTDVIIAAKAFSHKLIFGRDCGIPVVSGDWLASSLKVRAFISELEIYKIHIFEGCKFNVLGFSSEEQRIISSIIFENGGESVSDLELASKPSSEITPSERTDFVILNSLNTSSSYLNYIKHPALDQKWLRECILRGVFVNPRHYIINKIDLSMYVLEKEEILLNKMKELECSSKDYSYLKDCVFYVNTAALDDKKLKSILQFIQLGGGYNLHCILPCTTHIVTPHYTKTQLLEFTRFGSSVHLVHPEWLQQCFCSHRKLQENDYLSQQIEQPLVSSQSQQQLGLVHQDSLRLRNESNGWNNNNNNNSQFSQQQVVEVIQGLQYSRMRNSSGPSLASMFNIPGNNNISNNNQGLPQLSRMTSFAQNQQIGVSQLSLIEEIPGTTDGGAFHSNNRKTLTFKKQKEKIKPKSFLFKNCKFYLEETQYKRKLKQFKLKIFEHDGEILPTIANETTRQIFHILDDHPSNDKIMDKNKTNISYFSYRWIDFCIEKKTVIRNVLELQLFHLTPFSQTMPIPAFKGVSIYCSGYEFYEKIALAESIKIIGANYEFEKEKTSYLICERKDCKKMRDIQSYRENLSEEEFQKNWGQLKIVRSLWILDCITDGQKVDDEPYRI